MTTRTTFRTGIKDAIVNASITLNGSSVSVRGSFNDVDVTQADAPFIVINPVDKTDVPNRFGSDYTEQELPIQIYVFAANSFALDEVTEDVVDALPNRIDDAHFEEVATSYAFSPSQDVKMHSNTISALYERK